MGNRIQPVFRLGLVLAAAFALAPPSAAHHSSTHDQNPNPPPVLGPTTIIHFDAGSLIIPLDACYARPSFMSSGDLSQIITPLTETSAKCNGNSEKDDGIIPAYSLMFRLVQEGIPVNWAIKSGKTSWHEVDFSVVKASRSPVFWRAPGSAVNTTKYSAITTVRYRGAPFVIDAAYASQALALMDSWANISNTGTSYEDVDIHIAQSGFDAPIYRTIEEMPKLALISFESASDGAFSNEKTGFLEGAVTEALMGDMEGTFYDWVPYHEVVNGGVIDDYDLVWVPAFDATAPTPHATERAFMDALAEFADDGGAVVFEDGGVGAAEGYGTWSGVSYTPVQVSTQNFMTNGGGLIANGTSSTWDNGDDDEQTRGQDYSDPAAQFGGIVWTGIGGSQYNWKPRYDQTYKDGVRRMIYSYSTTDDTRRRWDFATWRKKDNDSTKGTIYYLGGYNWRRVTASGFRVLMNTLLATQARDHVDITEVARSSPIVAIVSSVETQYAGTFELETPPEPASTYSTTADAAVFEFPAVRGHLRALDVSLLAEGETTFEDASEVPGLLLFDAAEHLPAVNYTGGGCGGFPITDNAACRRIFTDTGSATAPTETMITTGNHDTLMPMLGVSTTADADTLIARIHAGRREGGSYVATLGGVDRSTPAVIEPSPIIQNDRPTMVYFGGTDGMLHAVCAEVGGECPSAGTELWAFLPSSELGKVKTNTTRLDGSPKVADIFGEFSGARAMRTVLTFQTGNRLPSAVYAIDITDPAQPDVLWKFETPGPGVGLAMGWVTDGSTITPMTFVQTAADPSSATGGFEVRAIETDTGELRWTQPYTYPSPVRDPDNPDVPSTAMPGGVTAVAGISGTTVEYLLVPSLYGQVYKLQAADGVNVYGTDPLFEMGEDFHPIGASVALYRGQEDGILRGLAVSGGFADPFAPSGSEWAPDDVSQYGVGFPIIADEGAIPIRRTDVEADTSLGVHIDFGVGQRAFSPAVVAGGEVFITTDTENVNGSDYGSSSDPTGRLYRKNLSDGTSATYVAIKSGAAAVDVSISTGAVLASGRNGVQRTDPPGFDAVGSSTEVVPETQTSRRLWLRLR